MAQILFQKDLTQDSQILDLYNTKVDLTAFNAAINDINNSITELRDQHTQDVSDLRNYIDSQIQSLKDNEIASLQEAINTLNGDSTVEGSVDYKIKQALDALINGAGEAYDTLKEIVDYINNEASEFQDLINNLNAKIDAIVGNAGEDYNTLEKIEQRIKEINARLDELQGDTEASISDVLKQIPKYKIDDALTINEGNKVTLSYVPHGDIIGRQAKVYFSDANGNRVITGIFTITKDSEDDTGKVYVIESDVQLPSDNNAIVEYFWTDADNQA